VRHFGVRHVCGISALLICFVRYDAGIATSLKILFDSSNCGAAGAGQSDLVLERNEVIALFNLLERLSTSIEVVRRMSLQLLADEDQTGHSPLGAIQDVTETSPLFSMFTK
jgi:Endoplasmic Reticulum Oxidoreductin 1 (ERO1)